MRRLKKVLGPPTPNRFQLPDSVSSSHRPSGRHTPRVEQNENVWVLGHTEKAVWVNSQTEGDGTRKSRHRVTDDRPDDVDMVYTLPTVTSLCMYVCVWERERGSKFTCVDGGSPEGYQFTQELRSLILVTHGVNRFDPTLDVPITSS